MDDNFILNRILEVFPLDFSLGAIHSAEIRDRLNKIGYDIEPKPLEEYLRQIEKDQHLRVDLKGMYLHDGLFYPKVAHYTLTFNGKKFILNGGYKKESKIIDDIAPTTNSITINGSGNNINQSSSRDNIAFANPTQQNINPKKENTKQKNKTHWLQILYWVIGIAGAITTIYNVIKH